MPGSQLACATTPGRGRYITARREFIAGALVKNGRAHLGSFLTYHRHLGARHFVLLDNACDDVFADLAAREADAAVLSTGLKFSRHKLELKRFAARSLSGSKLIYCAGVIIARTPAFLSTRKDSNGTAIRLETQTICAHYHTLLATIV